MMDFLVDVDLTYRASVAVISTLWNREDIINDINEVLLEFHTAKQWTEIEDKVLKCLMTLELPNTLKISLQNFIQPMGIQILKWMDLCRTTFKIHPYNEKSIHFFWSNIGTLDHTRTAELIIEFNPMEKELCFCLACIFCIEKTLHSLWPELRNTVSRPIKRDLSSFESKAVVFWQFYLEGEIKELMNMTEYFSEQNAYEIAFLCYFDLKRISILNYFLKQIDSEKKKLFVLSVFQIILGTTRPREGNTLVQISHVLNEFDRINQLFWENAYAVLSSFLEWPSQKFFISLAYCLWNHIRTFEYINLFQDIVKVKSRFHIGDLYRNLFKEFWASSPNHLKEYAIHKCTCGTLLRRMLMFSNIDDILQIFFNDCSPEEKQNMIFYFEGMNICDYLVKKKRWDSLKMLVTNCISPENLEEFLEQYQNYKPSFWNKETEMRTNIFFEKIREWY